MSLPTLIFRALSQGFNMINIVNYLIKNNKSLSKKIESALKQGYSHDQIGEYLSKGEYSTYSQREKMLSGITQKERADLIAQGAPGDWKKPLNAAIGLGSAALGAYGTIKGFPGIANTLRTVFGGNNPLNPGPAPMANAPLQPNPISPAGSAIPTNIQQIPQITPTSPGTMVQGSTNLTQNAVPQQIAQQPPIDSSSIIREMQLEPKINNLLNSGNDPEIIGHILYQQLKPNQKKWLDSQIKEGKAKSLPEMVKEFASTGIKENKISKEMPIENIGKEENTNKPVKGNIVAAPHGIVGDIESIREKEALVKDHSGKLHKVKVEDLIESPLPEKELSELHDELIRGIEKKTGEEVSRNVNWAGYDPDNNELLYLPHDGSAYVYAQISPENVELLTNILGTRKTTGSNFIGAWKEGTKSPIGAQMAALIKKLQSERGGKGNEYIRKYSTVYSALEPAVRAAKEAKRKKRI